MNNLERLGASLAGRMKQTAQANTPTTIELGTINSDLSLTTDSLKARIPKGSYMINLMLAASTYRTENTTHSHSGGSHGGHESGSGDHSHSGGSHDHRLPDDFRGLKSGDRVLVAWCGMEPVVMAIVVGS